MKQIDFTEIQDADNQLQLGWHGVIEASAGTGKTYTIMRIVLQLLIREQMDLDKILLVTYTEKAAGEMKDRIRELLEAELPKQSGTIKAHLQAQLEKIDTAQVYTIHGFCNNVLQRWAFENREQFELVMDDDGPIFSRELYQLLRVTYPQRYGAQLLELLRATGVDKVLLKDAGLFARVAKRWDPERQVLHGLLAAEGAENNPLDLLQAPAQLVQEYQSKFGTQLWSADSEGAYWLSEQSREGLNGNKRPKFLRVLSQVIEGLDELKQMCCNDCDSHQVTHLLSVLFHEDPLTYLEGVFYKKGFEDNQDRYHDFWENCLKPEMVWLSEQFKQFAQQLVSVLRFLIVHEVRQNAEAEKRARGVLTFDDMLQLVHRAVVADGGENPLVELLRKEYRCALIDEFQDTDGVQWEIFSTVFLDTNKRPDNRLFLIGDPKQAIYSFRGAELNSYFTALQQMVQLPAGQVGFYRLATNWRSAPPLVKATNLLFGDKSWFKNAQIDFEPSHCPAEKDLRCNPYNDESGLPPIHVLYFTDKKVKAAQFNRHSAYWMAREIRRLVEEEKLHIPDEDNPKKTRPLQYRDICVLMRTRSKLSYYEKALYAAGVPSACYKKPKLYEGDEALQLHYLFSSLAEPENRDKMKLAGLTVFFDRSNSADVVLNDPFDGEQGEQYKAVYYNWLRLANEARWAELFARLMEESGLAERLISCPDGERRLANFQQILEDLLESAVNGSFDKVELTELLAQWRSNNSGSEEGDLHRRESERSRVQLMTMHASKGLEFPVVFIAPDGNPSTRKPDVWQVSCRSERLEKPGDETGETESAENLAGGLYWTGEDELAKKAEAQSLEEQLEEFRRLYYVGCTRPVYRLYLFTKASSLNKSGAKSSKQVISDFISMRLEQLKLTGTGEFVKERDGLILVTGYQLEWLKRQKQVEEEPLKREPLPVAELPPVVRPEAQKHRELLTSFSSLSRFASQLGMVWHSEDEIAVRSDDDLEEEDLEVEEIPELGGTLLFPRGAAPGSMLHELFEQLDWSIVCSSSDAAELTGNPVFAELVEGRLDRWRIKLNRTPEELAQLTGEAARLVWNALRLPVALPDGSSVILAELKEGDRLAEKEFYLYFKTDNGGGYLNGIIDLVFRYQNKYYILDWKSNWLPGYADTQLKQCMEHHNYFLQMQIYSLAVMEWLENLGCKEDDFGGAVYLFLRGADLDKNQTAGYPQRFKRQDVEDVRSKLLKYDVEKQEALG